MRLATAGTEHFLPPHNSVKIEAPHEMWQDELHLHQAQKAQRYYGIQPHRRPVWVFLFSSLVAFGPMSAPSPDLTLQDVLDLQVQWLESVGRSDALNLCVPAARESYG